MKIVQYAHFLLHILLFIDLSVGAFRFQLQRRKYCDGCSNL